MSRARGPPLADVLDRAEDRVVGSCSARFGAGARPRKSSIIAADQIMADRIGDVLARDIGCGAMNRLEQ